MKRLNRCFWTILLAVATVSCVNELDNYDAPDSGIKGRILDAGTNEPIPLPVQGSTGVIINLFEQNTGATKSVDFYAKSDGTYENSYLFNCAYKIVVNGPFVSPCEGLADIKGQTVVDLKAIPYSRINATATAVGKVVTIPYEVEKTDPAYVVSEVYGYWNFAPGVDNNNANQAGKITVKETKGTITFNLEDDKVYKENLYKIQSNGNKIYLRIGAKTNGVINYSVMQTIVLQ